MLSHTACALFVIEHERLPVFWLAGLLTLEVVHPQFVYLVTWSLYDTMFTETHGDIVGGCSTDPNIAIIYKDLCFHPAQPDVPQR